MSSDTAKRAEEMTLAELKARASELGIEASEVEAIETTSEVPVKADWLREVLKAEQGTPVLKDEWREAGSDLVKLFAKRGDSKEAKTDAALASKLAAGTATNLDLIELRERVKATAASLREADQSKLATQFSEANYMVRRAERATRQVKDMGPRPEPQICS
ncbi:MAG: hypothetical protein IID07_14895 [Gemmatimonadetes bacterium]|nr:hypothetical protein [Gemmatimonadota bacterium]